MQKPEIISTKEIGSAKWLHLSETTYRDHEGVERTWESANRVNDNGAVGILATLQPSNRLVLIKQFRIPVNTFVIECPAGLIDAGEDVGKAALREFYEETGYTGTIKRIYPPVASSPGLTSETISLAIVEVDEECPENIDVTPQLEGGENIETLILELDSIGEFLDQCFAKNYAVDAKVISWLIGQGLY